MLLTKKEFELKNKKQILEKKITTDAAVLSFASKRRKETQEKFYVCGSRKNTQNNSATSEGLG